MCERLSVRAYPFTTVLYTSLISPQAVMRDLIKRYIMHKQRTKHGGEGVTEDDINELKQDVSAFRFELLEILRNNGMKTPNPNQSKTTSKRLKMWRALGWFAPHAAALGSPGPSRDEQRMLGEGGAEEGGGEEGEESKAGEKVEGGEDSASE